MKKFKNTFFYEFITSCPLKCFMILVVIVISGMLICKSCKHHNKVVKMKEDVMYVKPLSDND